MQPIKSESPWGHGFADVIDELYSWDDTVAAIEAMTDDDVARALRKARRNTAALTDTDFMALISEAAVPHLEEMAQLAMRYTQERFGKTISMYLSLIHI